jgi:hypothetical protein
MMYRQISRLALLVLLGGLAACAATQPTPDSGAPSANFNPSKDPYWEDPRWDKTLLDIVQTAVHDPADPTDMSAPGLHAMVKFTYLQGTLEYPEIVTGTGNPDMDKLMLHQLAAVQAPQATGLRSDEPHEFVLDLDMPTPYESIQSGIYAAIDNAKIYTKAALIAGATGNTTVDFEYLDGEVRDITVTESSKDKELDKASLGTVTRAHMPSVPPVYTGKSLHIQLLFCYTLYSSPPNKILNRCPMGNKVIVIQGTRIRRG